MPRSIRYIIPNLPHHATQRGNNHQKIFFEKVDRLYFLSKLKEATKREKVLIGSYCLMTNHIHLLLCPDSEDDLIRVMKDVTQCYTQYINRKHKRTGKLWENRYKLNIVDPESEWTIARYIENNPVRAKMVQKAENYQYSSAKKHLLGVPDKIVTKDIMCGREKNYKKFFHESESMDPNYLAHIKTVVQQEKVLGSETFIKMLENRLNVNLRVRKTVRQPSNVWA